MLSVMMMMRVLRTGGDRWYRALAALPPGWPPDGWYERPHGFGGWL